MAFPMLGRLLDALCMAVGEGFDGRLDDGPVDLKVVLLFVPLVDAIVADVEL